MSALDDTPPWARKGTPLAAVPAPDEPRWSLNPTWRLHHDNAIRAGLPFWAARAWADWRTR